MLEYKLIDTINGENVMYIYIYILTSGKKYQLMCSLDENFYEIASKEFIETVNNI